MLPILIIRNFNPRAPYGARPRKQRLINAFTISIHAPHTGRDRRSFLGFVFRPISIHAPHTGRDNLSWYNRYKRRYFNPRAPYGARPVISFVCAHSRLFQSTRPIRGATLCENCRQITSSNFNPRAPYGARQEFHLIRQPGLCISIHAPHTGRDSKNA